MSEHEIPGRVRRAFGDHGSFEQADDGMFESVTTPFDGTVSVATRENGHVEFDVEIRVPMLSAVVADEVAEIVEDGWYETFELRLEDVDGVVAGDHELDPAVRRVADEAVIEATFSDINERRGVDDAGAVIDYVEGTYVEGIIPGYEYTEPVTSILRSARDAAGTGF
ncbi:hypothetical protein E6P09_00345 [Haloferax mediterranei ATCC 33500]|uniref:Uncharacterized protein n=1 Tax=Haloferax mediterranei (strain ATCC 33500 / DSM 1411 / JCM 8866 / NBRC 14739 / NCIMB 2177 / R-4) TaxID=523841 RepID=I3R6U8_HALMT|nr:DUF5813 family protein [Haloferax mediterranei]AFK19958.1 hypothetical protein HFX_2270 [Haloferax mediterranei ATCC 33500]AHZ23334.1 hypothetical protein BM92_12100 [Haloferax mediterranei ATCC 33500]ELZ99502.1 hypothetical protein C439_13149 [Haloferax mediterranei ATCC 33500]MDX5987293.1 DUF5813 family protein [Haloferax mediterranei ATCC 33500]QCQ73813.1 hypothetical protein E6P09_00345 [Haloferax mediterranei ATCC 33500]